MTLGSFILGIVIMAVGFAMVYRTNNFEAWFGDLGDALGFNNANWLSWKLTGIALLLFGFLLAFGLLQLFLQITIGQLVSFGR